MFRPPWVRRFRGTSGLGRPGLALVVLSVVEHRLDAVRAVLDGAELVEVAARVGVHRATVHRWVARYLTGQLAGLADRSHRPHGSPRQVADAVQVAVAEKVAVPARSPGTQSQQVQNFGSQADTGHRRCPHEARAPHGGGLAALVCGISCLLRSSWERALT